VCEIVVMRAGVIFGLYIYAAAICTRGTALSRTSFSGACRFAECAATAFVHSDDIKGRDTKLVAAHTRGSAVECGSNNGAETNKKRNAKAQKFK
jgi:hypothetical protein